MTNEEINHRLATEIMNAKGWQYNNKTIFFWNVGDITYEGEFTPTTDLNQAMMCVEAYLKKNRDTQFRLHYIPDYGYYPLIAHDHSCYGPDSDMATFTSEIKEDSPALAICKAILEALDA